MTGTEPAAAPASAPVVEGGAPVPVESTAPSTTSAPVQDSTPVASPAAIPVAENAPVAEALPVETKAPEVPKSLLDEAPKAPDAAKEGDAPKAEDAKLAEPVEAPLPTYEAFTVPEGIQLDEKLMGDFGQDLAKFEASKPTHEDFQKFGQNLLNRHVDLVKETVTRLNDAYAKQWEKQTNEWRDNFFADPEIGGNRQDTTLSAARDFIRRYAGNETQQQELRDLMSKTGVGNHPALIRLMANANKGLAEPRPLAPPNPTKTHKSAKELFYGGKA